MPKRIQRSRAKGWRMPDGTVYVGRPTKWGNPYRVGAPAPFTGAAMDASDVKDFYCDRIVSGRSHITEDEIRRELRGKDLACWCGLDQPCHADVLLEIANEASTESEA